MEIIKMNVELPLDVIEAVHANQKQTAIKRLCEQQNLGLQEAQEIIELYSAQHPELVANQDSTQLSGTGYWLVIDIVIVMLGYGIYVFFKN